MKREGKEIRGVEGVDRGEKRKRRVVREEKKKEGWRQDGGEQKGQVRGEER